MPDERRPDPRPDRERFFRRERGLWVLAVVEFGDLSAAEDDKHGPAQETPEGHAVRLDAAGRTTHVTAINARWLLERDGELIATLRDGRTLRLGPDDVRSLLV